MHVIIVSKMKFHHSSNKTPQRWQSQVNRHLILIRNWFHVIYAIHILSPKNLLK